MLCIIGLGLGDERNITLRGLEAVKKCEKDCIEAYTSLLSFGLSTDGLSTLEKLYGRPITLADRETVEEKADQILYEARESDVAFLVVGDPFGATTHTDLVVQAKKLGIQVKVVFNSSVMNAIGVCITQCHRGSASYSSFLGKLQELQKLLNLLSLKLLLHHIVVTADMQVKEPTLESLCRGRKQYEPPRYMTINTAIEQLLEVEQLQGESAYNEDAHCVGFARLGSEDQMIVTGTMRQLPLHCLVIVGETRPVEEEMLDFHKLTDDVPRQIDRRTA